MFTESPVSTSASPCIQLETDEYSAADPARRRLQPKARFPLFASLSNLRYPSSIPSGSKSKGKRNHKQNHGAATDDPPIVVHPDVADSNPIIHLDNSAIAEEEECNNIYQWAVIYENQRGYVLVSIAPEIHLMAQQHHSILHTILLKTVPPPHRPLPIYNSKLILKTIEATQRIVQRISPPRWHLVLGLQILDDRHAVRHWRSPT
jgi:hypothetical protein